MSRNRSRSPIVRETATGHSTRIKNRNNIFGKFECDSCGKFFDRPDHLQQHQNGHCGHGNQNYVYPGGSYVAKLTVFDELLEFGISVEEDRQLCTAFATWDCEALLELMEKTVKRTEMDERIEQRLNDQNMEIEYVDEAKRLQFREKHVVATCALTSSVPGGGTTQVFCDPDPKVVVEQAHDAMEQLSNLNYQQQRQKFANEFDLLEKLEKEAKDIIENATTDTRREKEAAFKITRLIKRLDQYCRQLTILTYNGGRYDLNLVKQHLYPKMVREARLAKNEKKEAVWPRPIMKGSTVMCLTTETLRFIDVMLYLSPGTSLDKFIKAFNPDGDQKGHCPYELLRSYADLEKTDQFPPKSAFYSTLKNRTISDRDYEEARSVWDSLPTKNLLEFVKEYNTKDVEPMLVAVMNMVKVYWEDFKVDIFREAISIPGVCLAYLFKDLQKRKPATRFGLFSEEEGSLCEELYSKKSLCGGLSFIGQRIAMKDVTPIRGNPNKKVKKVIGYDMNALYLHACMQEMPTGHPDWWKLDESGEMKRVNKTDTEKQKERKCHGEIEYLRFRAYKDNIFIHTGDHGKQKKLGLHGYRVDGFAKDTKPSPTVFNYNGCYYHNHERGCLNPPNNKIPNADERKRQDEEQKRDLEKMGFIVETVWECEWKAIKKVAERLRHNQLVDPKNPFLNDAKKYNEYLQQYPVRHFQQRQTVHQQEMFNAIMNGDVFGFAKVDIETPENLKTLYEDFPPIIKHADVDRNCIGDYMRQMAEEKDLLKNPRDCLVGSYFGKEIWLMTPLLQFYQQRGIEIKAIHEVVQYDKEKTFEWFGQTVTEHRKQGDANKNMAILAEVYKLLGNSAYGKTITNLKRHKDTKFVDAQELEKLHNDPLHKKSVQIGEDCFEVHAQKSEVRFSLPMVIGLAVYNYAKLRMLEFIYDVLFKFLRKEDYVFLESDTDSVYLGLSADSFEELVIPELRAQFDVIKLNFFVQDESQKRTPGLMKIEKIADNFIGLCSKCYLLEGSDGKLTVKAKGVQNRNEHIFSFENFWKVLFCEPGAEHLAFNYGIRPVGNEVRTYVQERQGLTAFYCKRICFPDGSTKPLNV